MFKKYFTQRNQILMSICIKILLLVIYARKPALILRKDGHKNKIRIIYYIHHNYQLYYKVTVFAEPLRFSEINPKENLMVLVTNRSCRLHRVVSSKLVVAFVSLCDHYNQRNQVINEWIKVRLMWCILPEIIHQIMVSLT
jgi:hypothetical protein